MNPGKGVRGHPEGDSRRTLFWRKPCVSTPCGRNEVTWNSRVTPGILLTFSPENKPPRTGRRGETVWLERVSRGSGFADLCRGPCRLQLALDDVHGEPNVGEYKPMLRCRPANKWSIWSRPACENWKPASPSGCVIASIEFRAERSMRESASRALPQNHLACLRLPAALERHPPICLKSSGW